MIETLVLTYMFGMVAVFSVGMLMADSIEWNYVHGLTLASVVWPFVFAKALLPV